MAVISFSRRLRELAEAIDGRDAKWVKAAAAAPDIDKQINDTRELFKLCK